MIYGLDLSLSATGFASYGPGGIEDLLTVPSKPMGGIEPRLASICDRLEVLIAAPELVVMEGLSFGSNDPSAQERSGLHFMVRNDLWARRVPVLIVAPSALKKFITGSGGAKKEMVIREVFRRWKIEAADNNQADAAGLAYVGAAYLGRLEAMTAPMREVVGKLKGGKV